jgi:hypothetical protein
MNASVAAISFSLCSAIALSISFPNFWIKIPFRFSAHVSWEYVDFIDEIIETTSFPAALAKIAY